MQLGGEGYSPSLLDRIVDQGGRYAFAEAAHNLRKLSGLEISAQHVMRLTERLGGEWATQRDADVTAWQFNRLSRTYAERPAAVAVMLDGGRVQTRQEPSRRPPTGMERAEVCLPANPQDHALGEGPATGPAAEVLGSPPGSALGTVDAARAWWDPRERRSRAP